MRNRNWKRVTSKRKIREMFCVDVNDLTKPDVACLNDIKQVINNNPYTIINWTDGTKTIVKCQTNDTYNLESGIALCCMKKFFGNKGNYNEVFHKYCFKDNEK